MGDYWTNTYQLMHSAQISEVSREIAEIKQLIADLTKKVEDIDERKWKEINESKI